MPFVSTTPPGRLVQGDVFEAAQRTNDDGTPKLTKSGTVAGPAFFIAIAIAKTEPGWPAYKAGLDAQAKLDWPGGQHASPKFANKIIDGDGVKSSGQNAGQPWANNEGFAGCWVIKFESQFAATLWINDNGFKSAMPGSIKCGDYIRIEGECTTNNSSSTPGMYMHALQVVRDQEGEPIVAKTAARNSPAQAFGGQAPAPAPAQAANALPPTPPAAVAAPPPAASTPIAPPPSYDGFMQPPPAGPQLTPAAAANGTLEQYLAAGWTLDTMRANGLLAS